MEDYSFRKKFKIRKKYEPVYKKWILTTIFLIGSNVIYRKIILQTIIFADCYTDNNYKKN